MTEGTVEPSAASPGVATDAAAPVPPEPLDGSRPRSPTGTVGADRRGSWIPTWPLVTTKFLELRRRRGLMVVVLLLTIGLPFLVLGLRLLFHAVDPKSYGPAGSPSVFQGLCDPMAEFGFIIAAALGATAGTTDLTDGMFRHLVITGRSRLSLYLARIPAGLSFLLPLVAVAFAALCLVTSFEGVSQPSSINENGVSVPLHLDRSQLENWLLTHPEQAAQAFLGPVAVKIAPGGGVARVLAPATPAQARQAVRHQIDTIYQGYSSDEVRQFNPAVNEMVKVGLWIELEVAVGFFVGLGLGSLTGQRTLSTILLIVLQIIITPILANAVIPYFINGQRLVVGVATTQLRPAVLSAGLGHGGGRAVIGGGALGISPMPTWAMVAVIVGWVVGWSVVGAWRMVTRDA